MRRVLAAIVPDATRQHMKADISELIETFPDVRIAFVVAKGLTVKAERSQRQADAIRQVEQVLNIAYQRDAVGQIPAIGAWRDAYKAFGIKKTSYRCSVERLLRGLLGDRPLPAVNSLVDVYNRISVKYLFPVGADDLADTFGDISFRFATGEESFIPLGSRENDSPKSGEVIYADQQKVLCRRWNWYQDARSPVSLESRDVVLTVQSLGIGDLDAAVQELCHDITLECGGEVSSVVADAENPTVTLF